MLAARIEGAFPVGRYLNRALNSLPWGFNATIRHVFGSGRGGVYEWIDGEAAAARDGITALDLNRQGVITRFTTVWEASRGCNSTMEKLVEFSIE